VNPGGVIFILDFGQKSVMTGDVEILLIPCGFDNGSVWNVQDFISIGNLTVWSLPDAPFLYDQNTFPFQINSARSNLYGM